MPSPFLYIKTVLFQSTQFSSIWHIDRTLSGATTLSQSGPGSDDKGVNHIPQSTSINGALPSDCLVSYPGHSLGESYPSAEMWSVYSAAPANWAIYGLEHCLGIYAFRPTWLCLIINVLVTVLWSIAPFIQQMFLVTFTALWPTLNL